MNVIVFPEITGAIPKAIGRIAAVVTPAVSVITTVSGLLSISKRV
ncbi:MAG TPA: hypothetical protein VFM96_12245 [Gaiellaceae bacterium]|nr:hypothetical protein [Gaiellaceae bacterium]